MAAWIKILLGTKVGLGPKDFELDGDPAPPPQKGGGAPPKKNRPMFILAKRLDGSRWYLAWGRPQPRRLCVRWGSRPLRKRRRNPPPQFSAHFYYGQTAGWIKMPPGMEVGLSPGDFVLDGGPVPPKFTAHVYYS